MVAPVQRGRGSDGVVLPTQEHADERPEAAGSDDNSNPPASPNPDTLAEARELRPELADLMDAYFKHVPREDRPRSTDDVLAILEAHLRVGRQRRAGEASIRIFNPAQVAEPETGKPRRWAATSTVVDIVNDDMPYLVDSVIGSLTAHGVTVNRAVHPILAVRRDADGKLLEVVGAARRGADPSDTHRESWMHLLIDRLSDAERAEAIEIEIGATLQAVRAVNADATAITGAAAVAAAELRSSMSPRSIHEVSEAVDLLYWLTAGNLIFLGYRQDEARPDGTLTTVRGSGLGILRPGLPAAAEIEAEFAADLAPGPHPDPARHRPEQAHVLLTQASRGAPIHREVPPFTVLVRILGPDGALVRQHRFLGTLAHRALNAEISSIPVLRRTVNAVLSSLGAAPDSYTGQLALDVLSGYPRAELFWASPDEVLQVVNGALQLSSRRRLRAFLQPDPFGRFMSVLVFLPRDRYTTRARLAMQQILLDRLGGADIRYTARIGDSPLAAVHFTVVMAVGASAGPATQMSDEQLAGLNAALRATIRTWEDALVLAVVGGEEELDTAGALNRYANAFDEAYKEDHPVAEAVADLRRVDALTGPDALDLDFAEDPESPDQRRLRLFVTSGRVTLSRVLPILQSMGAEVVDERPYDVRRSDGTPARIFDFGLRFPLIKLPEGEQLLALRSRVIEAFVAAWRGEAEVDSFNALIPGAGLDWRDVAVLRAYAHYVRQLGSPYTQGYLEQVLGTYPDVALDLVNLFAVQFDPDAGRTPEERESAAAELIERITKALDDVASLDADRILRLYLAMITATVRTNAYRRDDDGRRRSTMAFKLTPANIPGMPKPIPAHEMWVYSPRLEGVHLRFGAVARGGLRWSDRPEDFRTEILGLVKAQEVKNAVIVPVGAKGGFVLKQAPATTGDPAVDRDALMAEGVTCYRSFIAALLDLTDNRVHGEIVPPPMVVRRDADDPYLVVAADKGTATFSDYANGVAADYGFWLGDAFASGGSAGYDHKAMGITARGAWESVKHHFRELGLDTQTEDFTVVGVGDMSGDVFGNGMLLSERIHLVAAFDHRHVFIDPSPDPATSYVERRRLFDKPRSSWADYDTGLLSAGGGVWPRTAKSIPISEQARAALGLDATQTAMAPADLMHAILLAPVDLLWNGGIGTYVKSAAETNAAVGDKANDALRVNGGELRARVVGEGGNLGVTQLGRIEYSRAGGRINTDAIDNSAGVDTSDHEVNIKIAVQPAVASGRMTLADRDALLVEMTDDVARLVLADNIEQNRLLGVARHHAGPMFSVHARLIDALVASGRLDRGLEFLPSHAQIESRMAVGESLTSPELSVLAAYVKSAMSSAMLHSDLPDDPAFSGRLIEYFPPAMQAASASADSVIDIAAHPLAREIITTMTVNEVVNGAGITYAFRLAEEAGADPTEAIRAYQVTTEVFQLPILWRDIAALDNAIPAACQDTLYLELRRLLDRGARWLLAHRPRPLSVTDEIARYRDSVAALSPRMPRLVRGPEHVAARSDANRFCGLGAPNELANRVAYALFTFSIMDIVDIGIDAGRDLTETAELYYAVSAHLDFDQILTLVTDLARGDRWHALARQSIRDDLYRSLRQIVAGVLVAAPVGLDAEAKIEAWESANIAKLGRAKATLGQILAETTADLASLSVAASEIRSMIP